MDPRTFLPPRTLEVAPAPRVGEHAPPLGDGALTAGRPAVVAFLRHAGCPFAEATMKGLRAAASRHPGVDWIAVSHAPEPATGRWCRAVGGPGEVRLLSDPRRELYAGWGLGRTNLTHFLGRRALAAAAEQARGGIRNRHPVGTRWQQAGTFGIDGNGIVRWRHIPDHAGELPDLAGAAGAVCKL